MLDFNNLLGDGIGSIQLIQQCGNDKMIVNAARVSHGRDNNEPFDTVKDTKLIKYLIEHGHTSPFEHNLLTVKVKLPLNIGEQWLRHRIGWSYNKESGRYIDMTKRQPEFYIPQYRKQSKDNRQASVADPHIDPLGVYRVLVDVMQLESVELYNKMIEAGIAKEQARMVLPQSLYMSMFATCNLHSLMHFIKLRRSPDAQWEMRQYARALSKIAKRHWPVAMEAWEQTQEDGEHD